MAGSDAIFENDRVLGVDFSGRHRFRTFTSVGSVFEDCRFANIRPSACNFGAGAVDSIFRNCTFDGADLFITPGGYYRFERCSFRDVRIRKWKCVATELVDCTFTGRIDEAVFSGAIPKAHSSTRRTVNQFEGNDFSGAKLLDVAFQGGIDLAKQRLPQGPDDWYLENAAAVLTEVRRRATAVEDLAVRRQVLVILQVLERQVESGQHQVFANWEGWGGRPSDDQYRVFRQLCHDAEEQMQAQQ